MPRGQRDDRLRRDIIGIGLAALGAVVLVSLVYGQQGTGFLPRNVSQGLLLAFGVGAYLTPVILLALGVLHKLERQDLGDMHTAMDAGGTTWWSRWMRLPSGRYSAKGAIRQRR